MFHIPISRTRSLQMPILLLCVQQWLTQIGLQQHQQSFRGPGKLVLWSHVNIFSWTMIIIRIISCIILSTSVSHNVLGKYKKYSVWNIIYLTPHHSYHCMQRFYQILLDCKWDEQPVLALHILSAHCEKLSKAGVISTSHGWTNLVKHKLKLWQTKSLAGSTKLKLLLMPRVNWCNHSALPVQALGLLTKSVLFRAVLNCCSMEPVTLSVASMPYIGPSEPMQNYQTCFFSNICLKFYNIIKNNLNYKTL